MRTVKLFLHLTIFLIPLKNYSQSNFRSEKTDKNLTVRFEKASSLNSILVLFDEKKGEVVSSLLDTDGQVKVLDFYCHSSDSIAVIYKRIFPEITKIVIYRLFIYNQETGFYDSEPVSLLDIPLNNGSTKIVLKGKSKVNSIDLVPRKTFRLSDFYHIEFKERETKNDQYYIRHVDLRKETERGRSGRLVIKTLP